MTTRLAWDRSHGELGSVDPPLVPQRGLGADLEAEVVDAGAFTTNTSTQSIWDVLVDSGFSLPYGEIPEFIQRLEESAPFRRGEVAATLWQLKELLQTLPEDASGDQKVSLPLGTVVLMAHHILRHQG